MRGRPIEYNEEIRTKANEYINKCVDEEVQRVKSESNKGTTWELGVNVNIPTLEGLAVYLDIARSTLYLWRDKFPEFSDIIEKLQSIQAERLLNNGLSGTYNSTIAKVLLTKHGYVERSEHTGKDGEDLFPKPLLGGTSNVIQDNNSNEEAPSTQETS